MWKSVCIILLCVYVCSCSDLQDEKKDPNEHVDKIAYQKEDVTVKLAPVLSGDFYLEVISNGKTYAQSSAEIRFPTLGKINAVYIKNGDYVNKGQVLAVLDGTELASRVVRCKAAVDKALIDLDDRLIDYGYRLKDSVKVPQGIMQMAKTRSGYINAVYDYADAKNALSKTKILAPFFGKVADVEAREFNSSDNFRKLCTLIDDREMQVDFNVLESEFRILSKGSAIKVVPYGTDITVSGFVTQINPVIDANGMIKITAIVKNTANDLINGMSVKIVAQKTITNKLYVPKEAVLNRQNRDVVFTYENGRAKWNYVEVGLQNSRYMSIQSGLKAGQKVIISNNANLAQDSEVTVDESTQ